jgi:hypothetical protein
MNKKIFGSMAVLAIMGTLVGANAASEPAALAVDASVDLASADMATVGEFTQEFQPRAHRVIIIYSGETTQTELLNPEAAL